MEQQQPRGRGEEQPMLLGGVRGSSASISGSSSSSSSTYSSTSVCLMPTGQTTEDKNRRDLHHARKTTKTKKKKSFRVTLPITLMALLLVSSLAQYVAASILSLFIVLELDFEPVQLTHFWMYMGWASWMSPVVGWLSDFVTIVGERRRPCALMGVLANAAIFAVYYYSTDVTGKYWVFVAVSFVQTLAQMLVSVPINGMVVEAGAAELARILLANNNSSSVSVSTSSSSSSACDMKTTSRTSLPAAAEEEEEEAVDEVQPEHMAAPTSSDQSSSLLINAAPSPTSAQPLLLHDNNHSTASGSSTTAAGGVEAVRSAADATKAADAERTRVMGKAQTEAMIVRSLGSLLGAGLQTMILLLWKDTVSLRMMLLGSSGLYLLVLVPLAFAHHKPSAGSAQQQQAATAGAALMSVGQRWRAMWARIASSCRVKDDPLGGSLGLLLVLTFVFVYTSMPDASVVYYQYTAVNFSFPVWFLSLNSCVGLLGSLLAAVLFNTILPHNHQDDEEQAQEELEAEGAATTGGYVLQGDAGEADERSERNDKNKKSKPITAFRVFAMGCCAASLGYITNIMLATSFSSKTLRIPNNVFVPLDNFYTSMMARFAFMPVLIVAADRCPSGFEAFVFELFTVASLGGSSVSALATASMAQRLDLTSTNWSNLWLLLAVCAGCKVLPIFFAWGLPVSAAAQSRMGNREMSSLVHARKMKGEYFSHDGDGGDCDDEKSNNANCHQHDEDETTDGLLRAGRDFRRSSLPAADGEPIGVHHNNCV